MFLSRTLVLFLAINSVSLPAKAIPFFEIQKDGKRNWILGTIHVEMSAAAIPRCVVDTMDKSSGLVSESGDGSVETQVQNYLTQQNQLAQSSQRPVRSFRALVGEAKYGKLRSVLEAKGRNIAFLDFVNAYMAYLMLDEVLAEVEAEAARSALQKVAETHPNVNLKAAERINAGLRRERLKAGFEFPDGVVLDSQIKNQFGSKQKPRIALDAFENEVKFYQQYSDQHLQGLVDNRLARIEALMTADADTLADYLVAHYRILPINGLIKYLNWVPGQAPPISPPYWSMKVPPVKKIDLDVRLDERHSEWVSAIERELAIGNRFVAVGAGHLRDEGSPGLITLLKAKGYSIRFIGAPKGPCKSSLLD